MGMRVLMLVLFCPLSMWAQNSFTCEGPRCDLVESRYINYFDGFQHVYMPELTRDIITAQAVVGSLGVPAHTCLERFATGLYGAAAATEPRALSIPGSKDSKRLDEAGFAVGHGMYVGVNTGWVLASVINLYRDLVENPVRFDPGVLASVDVYVYGAGKAKPVYDNQRSRRHMESRGYVVRLHVVEPRKWFIFGFEGMSLGAGHHISYQDLKFVYDDTFNVSFLDENFWGWSGHNTLEYKTRTTTDFGDVRTGLRIAFLSVYVGTGVSFSRGTARIAYSRQGMVSRFQEAETRYDIHVEREESHGVRMAHLVAGVNIGFLTIQGTRTIGRNTLTNRRAGSLLIGVNYAY